MSRLLAGLSIGGLSFVSLGVWNEMLGLKAGFVHRLIAKRQPQSI